MWHLKNKHGKIKHLNIIIILRNCTALPLTRRRISNWVKTSENSRRPSTTRLYKTRGSLWAWIAYLATGHWSWRRFSKVSKIPCNRSTRLFQRLYFCYLLAHQINCRLLHFSCASIFKVLPISSKIVENVVWVSNSLDLEETPSYSASHPDPSCLHMKLQLGLAGLGFIYCRSSVIWKVSMSHKLLSARQLYPQLC